MNVRRSSFGFHNVLLHHMQTNKFCMIFKKSFDPTKYFAILSRVKLIYSRVKTTTKQMKHDQTLKKSRRRKVIFSLLIEMKERYNYIPYMYNVIQTWFLQDIQQGAEIAFDLISWKS